MTSPLLLRLIRRWYTPDEADERAARTERAHERAIRIRVKSEEVDRRVTATRESYRMANRRMNRNGGH
jgi:hypothetical protein